MAVGADPKPPSSPVKTMRVKLQVQNHLQDPANLSFRSLDPSMVKGETPRISALNVASVNNGAPFLNPPLSFADVVKSNSTGQQVAANKVTSSIHSLIESNPEDVPYKPISQFQGKIDVIFPFVDKSLLVNKLNYVLIGKFSHGRPSWSKLKKFFVHLNLSGDYNISVFDQKHVYIECSNRIDYNHIWLRLQWIVDGCSMRILKWTPQFSPVIESPIVPVWIRMEGIPLYMFEEVPLWQISNAIGKPIKIDARNLNRSMLNKARVCVELDLSKPLIDSFWVCFKDKATGEVKESFCVDVYYDSIPFYCSVCSHVGHRMDHYQRKEPSKQPDEAKQPQVQRNNVTKTWIVVNSKTGSSNKGKGIMYEEAVSDLNDGVSANAQFESEVEQVRKVQQVGHNAEKYLAIHQFNEPNDGRAADIVVASDELIDAGKISQQTLQFAESHTADTIDSVVECNLDSAVQALTEQELAVGPCFAAIESVQTDGKDKSNALVVWQEVAASEVCVTPVLQQNSAIHQEQITDAALNSEQELPMGKHKGAESRLQNENSIAPVMAEVQPDVSNQDEDFCTVLQATHIPVNSIGKEVYSDKIMQQVNGLMKGMDDKAAATKEYLFPHGTDVTEMQQKSMDIQTALNSQAIPFSPKQNEQIPRAHKAGLSPAEAPNKKDNEEGQNFNSEGVHLTDYGVLVNSITLPEVSPAQEWQVVKKNNKTQGVVTRAQAKASNNIRPDKVEEEQIAEQSTPITSKIQEGNKATQNYKTLMKERYKISRRIEKLHSRLMNDMRDGIRRQLLAELASLKEDYSLLC